MDGAVFFASMDKRDRERRTLRIRFSKIKQLNCHEHKRNEYVLVVSRLSYVSTATNRSFEISKKYK